jgi:DNA-binding NarL/FixJ family response regulator
VLLIVAHPVVGAGLETLLHLEERFQVRRVARFHDAAPLLSEWRPEIALIDGVLLQDDPRPILGIPSLVLSGSAVDAAGLMTKVDDARGWLRKDATAHELAAAIDHVLETRDLGGRVGRSTLIVSVAAVGVAIFLAWGFLALRSPG